MNLGQTTLIFLVLLSGNLRAFASSDVDLEMTPEEVWLRGPTCESLLPELRAFASWRERLGESAVKAEPDCECKASECRVDVTYLLPSFPKKVLGFNSEVKGPNSLNAALVAAGILPYMRASEPAEFKYWLEESGLCTQLEKDAIPEPGDIIAIRSKYGAEEKHAYVYSTSRFSFQKAAAGTRYAYEMLPVAKILGRQNKVSPECQALGHTECETQVQGFRCTPFKEYLKTSPVPAPVSVRMTQIERTEAQLQNYLFSTPDAFADKIFKSASAQRDLINKDLKVAAKSSSTTIVLKGLLERTESMIQAMKRLK